MTSPVLNLVNIELDGLKKNYVTFISNDLIFKYGLPRCLIVGYFNSSKRDIKSNSKHVQEDFIVNSEFQSLLHKFCREKLPNHKYLKKTAYLQNDGWLYLIDQRTANPKGTVPPRDIIGGFLLAEGAIVKYKSNPNHQIFSQDGFVDFGSDLNSSFIEYQEMVLRKTSIDDDNDD
jgi:hypothetical protein